MKLVIKQIQNPELLEKNICYNKIWIILFFNVILKVRCKLMKEKRVNYLDNLKIFLTCLVIAHHSAHAYGNIMGSWVMPL